MSKKTTNIFTTGLDLSTDPINQSKDSYSFGLNGIKENIINNPEVVSNEKGFTEYIDLGYQYILLGTRYLGKKEYVLFIKNIEEDASFNRILLVNNGDVTKTILDRTDLNFSSSHPIMSTYRINYKNQRIIYWVDGLNDDRVINIDIDSTAFDITLFSINSSASKPILQATALDTGGNLISGQYFIAISYNLGDSYTTEPLIISKPISIASENYYNNITVTEDVVSLYGQTDGDVIPNSTRKSIKINISELDNNFDSYNIIVVRQDLTFNVIKVIKNIDFTQNEYTFTGSEGEVDDSLTYNDLITSTVNYYASEAITQKDNRLLRGNSKLKASNINYQSFANNIVVNYKINEKLVFNFDIVNGYKTDNKADGGYYNTVSEVAKKHGISPSYLANTANNDADNTTFMRDEIYSLGIGFELEDGTETDVYHIPGRSLNYFNTSPTGIGEYNRLYTPSWDDDIIEGQPRWKIRNTAIKESLGKLAYWRSSQTYPTGYGYPNNGEKNSSGNSYIRHHKMPSDVLEPIYRTEIVGDPNRLKGEKTNYKIYKRNLGLEFSNISIPEELQDIIKKIKFFYTPRDITNKSILSKGIVYKLNTTDPITPANTFNYNLSPIDNVNKFEFISPEINFNFKETNLSGNTIKVCGIDKGYVNYAGSKELHPSESGNNAYYLRLFNYDLYRETERLQGIVSGFCFYNQRAIPKEEIYSRKLNKIFYVDGNYSGGSDIGTLNFLGAQNTAVLELIDPLALKPSVVVTPIASYYPELLYPTGSNVSNQLYTNIEQSYNLPFPDPERTTYNNVRDSLEDNSWASDIYYDTTYYIQICNNKEGLYGTINNLKYTDFGTIVYSGGSNITSPIINGGDTVIDLHHFKKTKVIPQSRGEDYIKPLVLNYPGGYSTTGDTLDPSNLIVEIFEMGLQSFGSFFCETDLNIRMRREGEGDDEKYFPKFYYNISNIENISGQINKKEFYKIETPYNNKYLKPYFAFNTTQDDINSAVNDDIRYYTRIIYSDKQNLEDKTDNYRKVRANNYRDLPLDKGGISIFFVNQDKLYAVTRDTIFNVYTSNQSLRGLNETTITVGTGEFLGTEPIDLISIDGGFAGTSSKLSFVESPYGYLFVDRYKGKVILFTDSPINLVDKDVVEFFKNNFELQAIEENEDTEFDNPLNNYGYVCGYDNLLNRFLITKLDYKTVNGVVENKSFTLSYSPIAKQWLFEHSYLPNNYIIHPNSLLTKRNDTQIKQFNKGNYGRYFDEDIKPFIIETIFNEFPTETKVFDNLTINLKSSINDISTNKFFDKVILSTEYQCSGEIELDLTNLTKKERNWMINKFSDLTNNLNIPLFSKNWNSIKDQYPIDKVVNNNKIDYNKPWFNRARFRDKFLKVRFIENNLENNKLMLNFVSAVYRPSQR